MKGEFLNGPNYDQPQPTPRSVVMKCITRTEAFFAVRTLGLGLVEFCRLSVWSLG